ncbi:MAG: hypothetical protein M3220_14235 [Chloroflexota bacterium]|nr:hypothetical protein [Chloroflexota bacterium]
MLEWEVLEDNEQAPPASSVGRRSPSRNQLLRWLILLLLLVGVVAGAMWWQMRQQEQALRGDLTGVLEAEARIMAVGEWEQARSLLDPDAPPAWKNAYLYHMSRPQHIPGAPTLRSVSMNEEGTVATVVVAWPRPEESSASLSKVVERRAYRLVDGTWRRTALPVETSEVRTVETEHFVLRGEASELTALSKGAEWRFDPEALYHHLAASWPDEWLERRPITLIVKRQEFGPAVQKTPSRRTLLVNSPRLSYVVTNEPLSSAAYYRLQLTDNLILKIVPVQRPVTLAEEDAEQYVTLQRQLQWAEARWWALDEEERKGLRNAWRASLAGEWHFPLDPTAYPDPDASSEEQQRHWMAMNLLLDYLISTRGREAPGQIAAQLAAQIENATDSATLFLAVTNTTLEELETHAREYALTTE